MIRILKKNDCKEYINLIRKFRQIDINITQDIFNKIYDQIFLNSVILVYIESNKIVGSVTLIIEQKFIYNLSKIGHIEDVFVDNNYRNKGIGSKLIQKALEFSKEKGCYKVILVCNKETSNFYKYNKFEIRGLHMSYLIKNT